MKKVVMMLRHHIKEDFNPKAYLLLLLFLTICMIVNYYFNFEDDYVDKVPDIWKIPANFLWLAFPYFISAFIILPIYNKKHVLQQKSFWLPSLFILICLAVDSGFPVYQWLVKENFPYQLHLLLSKIFRDLLNIPFILLPALLFYKYQREENGFYGLSTPFNPRPYLLMFLVILPLLIGASFLENFNSFYPMYKSSRAHAFLNIPEQWVILLYEIVYGWNFVSVEFVFRGFLVIGMAKVLGRQAILPMVALYCFYHFGKPAGEAISSIFGGYILGVIAYNTRSIFGGVILHIGIAWTMEVLGFLHNFNS